MSDTCAIVARVDAVRRAALVLVEHPDADTAAFGAALLRWADYGGSETTLDAELGLVPGWRAETRRARRDAMLADLRCRRFADLKCRAAFAAFVAMRRARAH